MNTAIFVNTDSAPYVDYMMRRHDIKTHESRTKRTLDHVINQRVFIAESGHGKRAICRCSAVIGKPIEVRSRDVWKALWLLHRVPEGSKYDWISGNTTVKYLYPLYDLKPCEPFPVPDGKRRGRTSIDWED